MTRHLKVHCCGMDQAQWRGRGLYEKGRIRKKAQDWRQIWSSNLSNWSEQRFATAADILKMIKYTIYRRIKKGTDFDNYWAAKKPFINERKRKRRIEWCCSLQPAPPHEWTNVLWSDESPFVLRYSLKKRYGDSTMNDTLLSAPSEQSSMTWTL